MVMLLQVKQHAVIGFDLDVENLPLTGWIKTLKVAELEALLDEDLGHTQEDENY